MRIEQSIYVARPVTDVYEFLCDETRLTEWRDGLLEVDRISPAGPLDGALYREVLRTPLGPQTVTVRLNTKPLGSVSFRVVEGRFRPHGTVFLRRAGKQTQLTYYVEYAPLVGFATPLDKLFGRLLSKNVERSLRNLKRILEP
jgi:hypothetical protein